MHVLYQNVHILIKNKCDFIQTIKIFIVQNFSAKRVKQRSKFASITCIPQNKYLKIYHVGIHIIIVLNFIFFIIYRCVNSCICIYKQSDCLFLIIPMHLFIIKIISPQSLRRKLLVYPV